MPQGRPFKMVSSDDQWRRCAHEHTSLDGSVLRLELVSDDKPADLGTGHAPGPAGLAFDPRCRLFHGLPESGRVERLLWARDRRARPDGILPAPFAERVERGAGAPGTFSPAPEPEHGPLLHPTALAIDDDCRMFIAETGRSRLLVYDLFDHRIIRTEHAAPNTPPIDLATDGRWVHVVLRGAPYLWRLASGTSPERRPLPDGVADADRVVVTPGGELVLLRHAGLASAQVVPWSSPDRAFAVPHATDLAVRPVDGEDGWHLVVARRPGDAFRCFTISSAAIDERTYLRAPGYDGRGIVVTPDNRIGYWAGDHFRHALRSRSRFAPRGRVHTFRLDSEAPRTRWGTLYVDACIPAGAEVRVHCTTVEEEPPGARLPLTPPADTIAFTLERPDLSPLMPATLAPATVKHRLHERWTGSEVPWVRARVSGGRRFGTYEAPIAAPPGRYLYVTLELRGDGRVSPYVSALRAEHPGHDLVDRLPALYGRDVLTAGFLDRFLGMIDGQVSHLGDRARARHALLDPESAPDETLPWLGDFLGWALDERWSLAARRRLIANLGTLLAYRGTVWGLRELLRIYLEPPPPSDLRPGDPRGQSSVVIVEHFRLRGRGGAIVGEGTGLASTAILGGGFRVGGGIAEETFDVFAEDGSTPSDVDPFAAHAHRFSVVIVHALTTEQRTVVNDILEAHRPAHTLVDVCTVDAGMRAGIGLYTGLTSAVGRSGGFETLRTGRSTLGRQGIVGRSRPGVRVGSATVGRTSRSG